MNTRSSLPSLLMTTLLFAALMPLSSVSAAPAEASEFYYGVEYDWSSVDTDLENFTGLDVPEILGEVMGAADDAGFNLIIGQLQTGSSNVYVHHTEDISTQTIMDASDNPVAVWSRTDDVTLRHGILADSILQTDWSETVFGSPTTGFDVDIVQSLEQVLTVDISYTEYLDDNSNLVGADMEFSMDMSAAIGLNIDALFEGDNEEFPIDFDSELTLGYSITDSSSEWRLGSPDSVYADVSSNEYFHWECEDCGSIDGDYTGAVDYSFSVSGIPTEDFGLDAGEFDFEVTDTLTDSGTFDMDAEGEFSFDKGDSMTVDLGDGDGLTTQVQSCETCPPGNPLMFLMMGHVLVGSGEAFAEQIGEDLGDGITEAFEDFFGLSGDNAEPLEIYYFSADSPTDTENHLATVSFMQGQDLNWDNIQVQVTVDGGYTATCSNPGTYDPGDRCSIDSWGGESSLMVGSGFHIVDNFDLCPENQSCDVAISISDVENYRVLDYSNLYVTGGTPPNSNGTLISGFTDYSENITLWSQLHGPGTPFVDDGDVYFTCDDAGQIDWNAVNNGVNDCADGSDEAPADGSSKMFTCEDGTTIDWDLLNNYQVDCSQSEDEGVANHYTFQMNLLDSDNTPLSSVELTACEYGCDHDTDTTYLSADSGIPVPSTYGSYTMCIESSIWETGASSPIIERSSFCEDNWVGPRLSYSDAYSAPDSDMMVGWDYQIYGNDGYTDITTTVTIHDANNNVVFTQSISELESGYNSDSGTVSVLEEGDYCLTVSMTGDGASTPFASEVDCTSIVQSTEGPSDRVEAVFGALADSGLESVLEAFGENLEDRMQTIEPFEEFPYNDGMWAPLWSNEHAAMVGVGVYVMDDNGAYTLTGPQTQGYANEAPAKLSIRYLTGVAANAQTNGMADATTIDDIVEVENHNLADITADLEEAGIDVSNLTLPQTTPTNNQTSGDDNPTPPTAEDLAEDAGLLPFLSPVSMAAVIALAGVVAGSRKDRTDKDEE